MDWRRLGNDLKVAAWVLLPFCAAIGASLIYEMHRVRYGPDERNFRLVNQAVRNYINEREKSPASITELQEKGFLPERLTRNNKAVAFIQPGAKAEPGDMLYLPALYLGYDGAGKSYSRPASWYLIQFGDAPSNEFCFPYDFDGDGADDPIIGVQGGIICRKMNGGGYSWDERIEDCMLRLGYWSPEQAEQARQHSDQVYQAWIQRRASKVTEEPSVSLQLR